MKEKRIQDAAEKDINIPECQEDIKTYRSLFKALEREENIVILSSCFAENVAKKLEERQRGRMFFKEYAWKAVAVLLFILVSLVVLVGVDAEKEILNSLASIKWYIIVASVLMIIIDLADKKFVRRII